MKKLNLWMFGMGLWLAGASVATAQCPNCTINLPANILAASVDTIHLDSIPDGQKNVYYEENLSFRLPQTTNPINAVDPSVPAGITINSIAINAVTGLPAGMTYKVDRDPAIYTETAPNARDGCVTFCGTPAQSGVFEVYIDAFVNVSILGDVAYQIPLLFTVHPDSSASFSYTQDTTCAPVAVDFTNLVPSNGVPGVSYAWDFGNGETSTLENPNTVIYTDPGTYPVTYRCIIDTFPYNLRRVIVTSTDCNDDVAPFTTNAPDLYLVLKDGSGTEIINNDPNTAPIVGTAPDQYPADTVWAGVQMLNLADTYTIEIWDDDNDVFNADDACGVFNFTANTNQVTFTNGAYAIEIWIEHYVDTIDYTDNIFVDLCSGVEDLAQLEAALNVYPNPSNGLVNVSFALANNHNSSLQITDMLGRQLFNRDLGSFVGHYNEAFDMQSYSAGVYLLTLQVGTQTVHKKIVIR